MTDDEMKDLAQGPLSPELTQKLAGPVRPGLWRLLKGPVDWIIPWAILASIWPFGGPKPNEMKPPNGENDDDSEGDDQSGR